MPGVRSPCVMGAAPLVVCPWSTPPTNHADLSYLRSFWRYTSTGDEGGTVHVSVIRLGVRRNGNGGRGINVSEFPNSVRHR